MQIKPEVRRSAIDARSFACTIPEIIDNDIFQAECRILGVIDRAIDYRCGDREGLVFVQQQMPGDFGRCLLEVIGAVAVKEKQGSGNPGAEATGQIDAVESFVVGIKVETSKGWHGVFGPEGA